MSDVPVRRSRLSAWSPALAWMLVVCWALIIVTLAMQPGGLELGRRRLRLDPTSAGHVVYFAALAFLMIHALRRHGAPRPIWWAFTLSLSFGIFIELLQLGVPGRTTSIMDLAADLVGTSLGAVAFSFLARRRVDLRDPSFQIVAPGRGTIAVHAALRPNRR